MGEATNGICPCGGEVQRSPDGLWHDGSSYPCLACGKEWQAEVYGPEEVILWNVDELERQRKAENG